MLKPGTFRPCALAGALMLAQACGESERGDGGGDPGTESSGSGDDGSSDGGDGSGDGGSGDGGSGSQSTGDTSGGIEPAPTEELVYEESQDLMLNPERGLYRAVSITEETSLSWVRDDGHTLIYSYVRLDEHRTEPIAQALLDDVETGLDAARDAGIKVILRFAYNEGPYPDSEPDAPLSWVLQHIAQVEPLLAEHEDVIALVQAGFIGAWGEWHTSTNNLLDDKEEILGALLDALPPSRMTQLRYPPYKGEMFGDPIPAAEAYDGSDRSRVGHHNDCFLASDTDMGTYPGDAIDVWKDFVEQDSLFVPVGGETCAVNPPRSDCPTTLSEMERFHYTFMNQDYHPDVFQGWVDGGCIDEIQRRLGYRFVLRTAQLPPVARPGGQFRLQIDLDNVGWAALFNPRHAVLVLEGGGRREEATFSLDPREWLASDGAEISSLVKLPSDLAADPYRLSLWLPDDSASLRDRPEYAIRFANDGTWESGLNVLGSIQIDPDGPGGSVDNQGFEVD